MTKAEYSVLVECFKEATAQAKEMEGLKSQVTLESIIMKLADDVAKGMRKLNSKASNLWMDCI